MLVTLYNLPVSCDLTSVNPYNRLYQQCCTKSESILQNPTAPIIVIDRNRLCLPSQVYSYVLEVIDIYLHRTTPRLWVPLSFHHWGMQSKQNNPEPGRASRRTLRRAVPITSPASFISKGSPSTQLPPSPLFGRKSTPGRLYARTGPASIPRGASHTIVLIFIRRTSPSQSLRDSHFLGSWTQAKKKWRDASFCRQLFNVNLARGDWFK